MAFDRKAYMKKYHQEWYQKNKARLLSAAKLYAANHAETLGSYKKSWYRSNRDHCLARAGDRYRAVDATARQAYYLKKLYGLSVSDYESLVQKQQGACAICKVTPKRRLSVDHCHATKRVRGLLCHKCNFAIGLFQDDTNLLAVAATYLKESL